MRKTQCHKCGVERRLMVQAKVKEVGITLSLKWLCFPCLLKAVGILTPDNEFNRIVAMKPADE